jgi:basic amino acid/polyamine antiporter, APA family
MKRTLGVFQLTSLGVDHRRGHLRDGGAGVHYAGPGLMLSFVSSGLGCAFDGLSYAEFAHLCLGQRMPTITALKYL